MAHLFHLQAEFDKGLGCVKLCEEIMAKHEQLFKINFEGGSEYIQSFKRRLQIRKATIHESKGDYREALEAIKALLRRDYR